MKAIAAATGATVNDVLMAALTGALRRYLGERGEEAGALHLRAVVPVNLRFTRDPDELGSDLGLVFSSCRSARRTPEGGCAVKARMDRLKRSAEAFGISLLLKAAGRASAGAQRLLLRHFARVKLEPWGRAVIRETAKYKLTHVVVGLGAATRPTAPTAAPSSPAPRRR